MQLFDMHNSAYEKGTMGGKKNNTIAINWQHLEANNLHVINVMVDTLKSW